MYDCLTPSESLVYVLRQWNITVARSDFRGGLSPRAILMNSTRGNALEQIDEFREASDRFIVNRTSTRSVL
jgi:hypothetical protein